MKTEVYKYRYTCSRYILYFLAVFDPVETEQVKNKVKVQRSIQVSVRHDCLSVKNYLGIELWCWCLLVAANPRARAIGPGTKTKALAMCPPAFLNRWGYFESTEINLSNLKYLWVGWPWLCKYLWFNRLPTFWPITRVNDTNSFDFIFMGDDVWSHCSNNFIDWIF